ncbi:low molecular weight phosphotyrosine protein phosphatase [Nocardioides sp. HDW12B]|nr:low molecular weight phosphotyrosine protein phosphatase [Nocardioides sp. HDW12B]
MAHVVLEARLVEAGLDDRVHVRSAGTGGWHVGEPMDRRAAATLRDSGHDPSRHRGQRFEADWFARTDLVLAMDGSNLQDLADLQDLAGTDEPGEPGGPAETSRLLRYRDLDPAATDGDRDVPDPYYGADDGFATVLAMVERTTDALVDALSTTLARS